MQFSIFSDEAEFHVDVPCEYATLIEDQLTRINDEGEKKAFTEAMLKQFSRVLSQFFDHDLQPPTEKQVAFAYGLSRKHSVEIPREALIYKSAMCDFLDKYSKHKSK